MKNDFTKETDIIERIRIKNISIREKKLIPKIYESFISRKRYDQLSRRLR